VLTAIAPWLQEADGVTISGGEPFDQPDALVALLQGLKLGREQDTLVYSGHPIEGLSSTLRRVHGLIDALISDPFQLASPQTLALRGSDNQRLHLLTDRGRSQFARYERRLSDVDRALDIMFDKDGAVWLAGIPGRDDMRRLRHLLGEQGHTVLTSDVTHRDPS
jgi:anaerobic ribonucleoside-triphosphate reductase activating protein